MEEFLKVDFGDDTISDSNEVDPLDADELD